MLKEFDFMEWITNNPAEKEIATKIEKALQDYGKIVTKFKETAKGKFIVIYAYDKRLNRYFVVDTIQIE